MHGGLAGKQPALCTSTMLHGSLPVAPVRCMLTLVGLMHALILTEHITAMCA